MAAPPDPVHELLIEVSKQLEEVKRYSAGVWEKVDTEITEIRDLCRRIERQLNETDRQVDKIENFERQLSEIRSSVQRMERKIK